MCWTRCAFRGNVFPQGSHVKSFSPVCTLKGKKIIILLLEMFWLSVVDHLICRTRSPFWANDFPQCSQLNGFSPVCTLKRKKIITARVFKSSGVFKSPHMLDKNPFVSKCFPTVFTLEKSFSCVHPKKKEVMVEIFEQSEDVDHLLWRERVDAWANVVPQVSHLKDFSPVCTLKIIY